MNTEKNFKELEKLLNSKSKEHWNEINTKVSKFKRDLWNDCLKKARGNEDKATEIYVEALRKGGLK